MVPTGERDRFFSRHILAPRVFMRPSQTGSYPCVQIYRVPSREFLCEENQNYRLLEQIYTQISNKVMTRILLCTEILGWDKRLDTVSSDRMWQIQICSELDLFLSQMAHRKKN